MNPVEPPLVRVEFENMRHSMLSAITSHLDEIKAIAEQQIKEMLSDKKFIQSIRDSAELQTRQKVAESITRAVMAEVNEEVRKKAQEKAIEALKQQ